jgi:ribosomal protein S18 acetylase RimI-like enzyme
VPFYPALLSSLGVVPQVRHLGIGRELVKAFCAAARKSDLQYVYLTTDQRDNEVVNRFYRSLGFNISATTTRRDGRTMNTYMKPV